jgi:hypothetical protein
MKIQKVTIFVFWVHLTSHFMLMLLSEGLPEGSRGIFSDAELPHPKHALYNLHSLVPQTTVLGSKPMLQVKALITATNKLPE